MPKTSMQKLWEAQNAELRGEIARYMAVKGLKMEEMATLVHMSRATMYVRYKHPETFTLAELRRLLSVIGGEVNTYARQTG